MVFKSNGFPFFARTTVISFSRWDGGRTEGEKVSGMNGKCPVYSSIGVATVVLRRECLFFLWFQGSSLTLCLVASEEF